MPTTPLDEVSIGIVGKYVEYEDSYKSLKEALVHGALAHNLKLKVTWIEAEGLEAYDPEGRTTADYIHQLSSFDGILVPRRLRQARHRGHAQRHPLRTRVPARHTSASASACRLRASNTHATSAA